MKVLQICSELYDSKVHAQLFNSLDLLGIEQTIFCFFRGKENINKNRIDGNYTNYLYADILKRIDRYIFQLKTYRVYKYLDEHVNLSSFDCTHAATLFTNGVHSYRIFKKYNIPYIVAVRYTDILFFSVAPHTWDIGRKILLNAKKIVFITPCLKEKLLKQKAITSIVRQIEEKFIIMPNGIDSYWIENVTSDKTYSHGIIYVGTFLRRKGLDVLIDAVKKVRKIEGYEDTYITVVGGGKDDSNYMKTKIEKNSSFVNYIGKVQDKTRLLDLYRKHTIFAMPSLHETFGLVYVEALTQNLALLYTKNDGIDGLFDESVGIGVTPSSSSALVKPLVSMLSNSNDYSNQSIDFERFRWDKIALMYKSIYENIIGSVR